jgi:hypothetical protein
MRGPRGHEWVPAAARDPCLPFTPVASGFALLAADLSPAPGLGHARLLSTNEVA